MDNIEDKIIKSINLDSLDIKELIFLTKIILKIKPNKLMETLLNVIIKHSNSLENDMIKYL